MIFKFPVYHEACDTCKNRFHCLSTNNLLFDLSKLSTLGFGGKKRWSIFIQYHFDLECIKLEPYNRVLEIVKKRRGYGSELEVTWQ